MPAGSLGAVGEGVMLGAVVVVPWFSMGAGADWVAGGVVVSAVWAYARPIDPATAAAATSEVNIFDAFMSKLLECCLSGRTVFEKR
jgi:hypothetical protein